jgi:hypothetical protein
MYEDGTDFERLDATKQLQAFITQRSNLEVFATASKTKARCQLIQKQLPICGL